MSNRYAFVVQNSGGVSIYYATHTTRFIFECESYSFIWCMIRLSGCYVHTKFEINNTVLPPVAYISGSLPDGAGGGCSCDDSSSGSSEGGSCDSDDDGDIQNGENTRECANIQNVDTNTEEGGGSVSEGGSCDSDDGGSSDDNDGEGGSSDDGEGGSSGGDDGEGGSCDSDDGGSSGDDDGEGGSCDSDDGGSSDDDDGEGGSCDSDDGGSSGDDDGEGGSCDSDDGGSSGDDDGEGGSCDSDDGGSSGDDDGEGGSCDSDDGEGGSSGDEGGGGEDGSRSSEDASNGSAGGEDGSSDGGDGGGSESNDTNNFRAKRQVHMKENKKTTTKKRTPKSVCISTHFYCRKNDSCNPRELQCTEASPLATNEELTTCYHKTADKCNYSPTSNKFKVYKGSSVTARIGIKGWFEVMHLYHHIVTYQGLAYEYGKYGTRVHDQNDPYFKYNKPGVKWQYLGVSNCTYNRVTAFAATWTKPDYSAILHNCQHFASSLVTFLLNDCKEDEPFTHTPGPDLLDLIYP